MRLKGLTLTGYKTFADKTQFQFDAGITAVIGPNGSGKSNVADAIRWALGEQSYSLLRGKRTDDMIFSGSAKRARASMCEVLMTFDNSDGFFPIEFTDVTLGRRAYRDGGNEYILNGNRVRLRDIADLLGNSGLAERTYTVIGQGLVDTALQLKPEERRALFEEAAGIGQYRDRRDDALRKLAETSANLQRATDILSEVTPRLKTLERQAERARQFKTLSAELAENQQVWFAWHYQDLKRKINSSGEARVAAKSGAETANTIAVSLEGDVARLREQQAALKAELALVQPRLDEARRRSETAQRELAVLTERTQNARVTRESLQKEIAERAQGIAMQEQRAQDVNAALITAQANLKERQTELEVAQQVATEFRIQRAALEKERNDAQMALMKLNAQVSGAQNRLFVLRNRQTAILNLMNEFGTRNARIAEQRENEQRQLATLDAQIARDGEAHAKASATIEIAQREFEAARSAQAEAQSASAASEAEFKMAERMNTFVQVRAQSRDGDLAANIAAAGIPGFRGILASLIKIHVDDEKAVRAALGEALTAVIIESEEGATRTRAWMSRQGNDRGRLTVITLPALRTVDDAFDLAERAVSEQARALGAQPVLPMINAPDWLKPALRLASGRAFVCRDLASAAEVARQLPAGCVCVTRDGEIGYASGMLGLTAGQRRAVVLGEPEPSEDMLLSVETAQARLQDNKRAMDAARQQFDLKRRALDETTRIRAGLEREAQQRVMQRAQIEQRQGRYEDQSTQVTFELQRTQTEQATLQEEVTLLAGSVRGEEAQQSDAHKRVERLDQQLREQAEANLQPQMNLFASDTPLPPEPLIEAKTERPRLGWMEALNFATAEVATAQANVRSAGQQLTQAQTELASARQALAARQQRLAELEGQLADAEAALTRVDGEAKAAAAELAGAEAQAAPILLKVGEIDQTVFAADTRRRDAERTLREAESRLSAAELELARHQDEMTALRERAVDAFDSAEAKALAGEPHPQPLPPGEEVGPAAAQPHVASDQIITLLEALPPVDALPEGLDEQVQSLRAAIKRLGNINFEAQAEYEELFVRHKFITEQSDDLSKAVATLQGIISELNEVMRDNFRRTFDAIAIEFQGTFKILFGGGQAKLNLVNGDSVDEAGIEIQAQPPGKRPANLALLSGGERSMTAAALLFAILKVKPTPFCVLDEMDAALDEANVLRFRSMVESLNDRTQFIIITHNRRTVEAANMVYGISMGPDSASIALSLRLDEADAAMKKHGE